MLSMTGKVDANPAPISIIPMAARAKPGANVSSANPITAVIKLVRRTVSCLIFLKRTTSNKRATVNPATIQVNAISARFSGMLVVCPK